MLVISDLVITHPLLRALMSDKLQLASSSGAWHKRDSFLLGISHEPVAVPSAPATINAGAYRILFKYSGVDSVFLIKRF